jgi:hypothetical protein
VTDDDDSEAAGQHLREAGSRRRSWWRWLLVSLLLISTLLITALFVTTLTADLLQHRWEGALAASRDAVPAVVGWAALLIMFLGRGLAPAERLLPADRRALREKEARAKREDSVHRAEQRVRDLTASLEALLNGPDDRSGLRLAGTSSPQLSRQVAETVARLDQARQWLASARAALSGRQQGMADTPDRKSERRAARTP